MNPAARYTARITRFQTAADSALPFQRHQEQIDVLARENRCDSRRLRLVCVESSRPFG